MSKKQKRKWKYAESEVTDVQCYDCGLLYGEDGWVDFVVPNDIWALINPARYEGGGLLCFNCMTRRLTFIGLEEVPYFMGSGPFSRTGEVPSWKQPNRKEM